MVYTACRLSSSNDVIRLCLDRSETETQSITRKVGNCDAVQLEDRPTSRQPFSALMTMSIIQTVYKFNTSATPIRFGGPDFISGTFSLATCGRIGIYQYFGYISELPIKILTSTLHVAYITPISFKKTVIIRRSDDFFSFSP